MKWKDKVLRQLFFSLFYWVHNQLLILRGFLLESTAPLFTLYNGPHNWLPDHVPVYHRGVGWGWGQGSVQVRFFHTKQVKAFLYGVVFVPRGFVLLDQESITTIKTNTLVCKLPITFGFFLFPFFLAEN